MRSKQETGGCEEYDEALLRINAAYQTLHSQRRVLIAELEHLRREILYRDEAAAASRKVIEDLHAELSASREMERIARAEAATSDAQLRSLLASSSWKITEPMRRLKSRFLTPVR